MNDYKELIYRLRRHMGGRDYFTINSDFAIAVTEAEDAIEQLVKERDAAVADLRKVRCCETCANCEMQIENEHDYCWCKVDADYYTPTDFCDKNWEWRGVQNE